MLFGLRLQPRYMWKTPYVWQYLVVEDPRRGEDGDTGAQPHLLALTLHDAMGEDGSLFLGEVAVLAQLIRHRMTQDQFKDKLLFPVSATIRF